MSTREERLEDLLCALGEPCTLEDIETVMGVTRRQVYTILEELADDGHTIITVGTKRPRTYQLLSSVPQ